MKSLFLITILGLMSTLSAQASIPFESVELVDSSIINSTEISSVNIRLNNDSAVIDSIETNYGEVINGDLVKKINNSKTLNSKFKNQIQSARVGGEGSGG